METTFSANESSADLGLHVQLGYEITAQSALYPFPEHYVRQIRKEIDPDFVPLWLNKFWRTPNGGIVWTGHHMLARHVRHPRAGAPLIANLHLPASRVYGIRYRNPLLEADILDGLSESERNQGLLPRFEQFTGKHLASMRYAMYQRNNKEAIERTREQIKIATTEKERRRKEASSELAYRRHHDEGRLKRAAGTAARVWVSDSLVKLRATAGMEAA